MSGGQCRFNTCIFVNSSVKISISGIRGVYGNADLSLYEVSRFCRLFARDMIGPGEICVIGRDTRPSSMNIIRIVEASLIEMGVEVQDLGIVPTPLVFYESQKYKAGCVVTASHNPLDWNGLKFILNGRGIFEDELQVLLDQPQNPEGEPNYEYGKSFHTISNYVEGITKLVHQSSIPFKHISAGLDPAGGAACGYINRLFKRLGHKFYSINDTHGISSRGADPTTDELRDLACLVVTNNLDFGLALDLDGDRLVMIDSKGRRLAPDTTLLLCIASALNLGMKKFVTSVDTSVTVEKFVRSKAPATVEFTYSKVGESNVVRTMSERNAEAGGEGSSAGFIMPNFNKCRDGLLAGAIISSLDTKTLDECIRFSSTYSQIRGKIPLPSDLHDKIIERISGPLKKESSELLEIDGVKALIDSDSWVLVRGSNTEHAIRVSVESRASTSQPLYDRVIKEVLDIYETVK